MSLSLAITQRVIACISCVLLITLEHLMQATQMLTTPHAVHSQVSSVIGCNMTDNHEGTAFCIAAGHWAPLIFDEV